MNNITSDPSATRTQLEPNDARRLTTLCGQLDEHIKQIERRLDVEIRNRGNEFLVIGDPAKISIGVELLQHLYRETAEKEIQPEDVHLSISHALSINRHNRTSTPDTQHEVIPITDSKDPTVALTTIATSETPQPASSEISNNHKELAELTLIRTKKCTVKPRGLHQQQYVRAIQTNDINFGVGPAGTGKTYLAVACAVEALLKDEVERILLVRPAVEAGEKLGFLPGDLAQKVDPYLRPLYDALYEMLGFETVDKLIARNVIEVAPLAYMRGRTLNNSFIILDESQNTTREQMKMFLTRIGFGSTAVITGDPSQVDLPRGQSSGLRHALEVLNQVKGISVILFTAKDVVRHPLVQRIVEAYEAIEQRNPDKH